MDITLEGTDNVLVTGGAGVLLWCWSTGQPSTPAGARGRRSTEPRPALLQAAHIRAVPKPKERT
jgi:hypothetical protein